MRRVRRACSCPTVRRRVVPAAGVQLLQDGNCSTPDDHFTAGPDRGVKLSGRGSVVGAGACPGIINAFAASYCGKRVAVSWRYRCPRNLSPLAGISLAVSMRLGYQLLRERGPGQTLRDHKRIVIECVEKFLQHVRLLGVLCHAVHFSLQLLGSNGLLSVVL